VQGEESTGYLSLLRLNRTQVFELLLVGLVLGVGVNLLATYISGRLSPCGTLIAGLAISIGAALFLLWRVLRPPPRVRNFSGFFLYDTETNALTSHDPLYELGSALQRYTEAAFAEDRSIKATWDANPISDLLSGNSARSNGAEMSLDLIRQATEYFILRSFSNRLTEHFASGEYKSDELSTLTHLDLPEILLQNRFLRTFAEPMEERAAFLPNVPGSSEGYSVISATSKTGAIYERFELVLPKGWGLHRSTANQIEIETTRFALTIAIESHGWGARLPSTYIPHYLGLGDEEGARYSELEIEVSIEIAPRRAWRLSPMVWKNYRWIDRWIADLEPQISQQAYLETIEYAGAETAYRLLAGAAPAPPMSEFVEQEDPQSETPDEVGQFKHMRPPVEVGDRVEHASFGAGITTGLEVGGVVVVDFDDERAGEKKFMWDYSPMRRV
jgi:hypothetical protein